MDSEDMNETGEVENGSIKGDCDTPDSKGIHDTTDSKGSSNQGSKKGELPPISYLTCAADGDDYPMDFTCKGKVVIFNHQNFESYLKLGERKGTEQDRDRLVQTFLALGFSKDNVMVYDDLKKNDLDNILLDLKMMDYRNCSCLIVCMLSHGDEGVLFAKDMKFPNHRLWENFLGSECPTLAGKPKIFLIQACQGDRLDAGVDVVHLDVTDGYQTGVHRIPSYADFLVVYSTVPGHYSWRNTSNGSWFIQSLCSVLSENGDDMDLLSVLTKVARRVAYGYMSNTPSLPHMNLMKQVPCITSMLTRRVFLGKKQFYNC